MGTKIVTQKYGDKDNDGVSDQDDKIIYEATQAVDLVKSKLEARWPGSQWDVTHFRSFSLLKKRKGFFVDLCWVVHLYLHTLHRSTFTVSSFEGIKFISWSYESHDTLLIAL